MEKSRSTKWRLLTILWNRIPWSQGLILMVPVWGWTHSGQTDNPADVFCVRSWGHCVGCGLGSSLLVGFVLFKATETRQLRRLLLYVVAPNSSSRGTLCPLLASVGTAHTWHSLSHTNVEIKRKLHPFLKDFICVGCAHTHVCLLTWVVL